MVKFNKGKAMKYLHKLLNKLTNSKTFVYLQEKAAGALLFITGLINDELKASLKSEYKKKGFLTLLAEFVTIVILMPSVFILLLILSEYMK